MSFLNAFIRGCNGLSNTVNDCRQANLMATARSEPDAIVRQQKIQMVLQLPTVTNSIVRGQMVTEIIHRSR
jgi:hypothetical protein